MRSGFFYVITGLILVSSRLSFAQTEASVTPVSSTTELPATTTSQELISTDNDTNNYDESYVDAFIIMEEFAELVKRFACRVEDSENELFTSPKSCFQTTNFTEDDCLQRKCCYIEEFNDDGSAGCVKRQSRGYIYSKIDEAEFFSSDENNGRKQSLVTASSAFIACVARGDTNCRMNLSFFTTAQLNTLIRDAVNGDPTAVGMVIAMGQQFLNALTTEGLVSREQALVLNRLFPGRCFWYPWGGWGNCEGICGTGVQTRIRRCQGCVPGTGACQGECVRKRACANPVGQICGYWSGWSGFGACSVSCGRGLRTRSRTCHGGRPGETGCMGPTTNQLVCLFPGDLLSWTSWSPCDRTCGSGSQTRVQAHTCRDSTVDTRVCNLQPCCRFLFWSPFTPCSTSCGSGFRTRTRTNTCPTIADDRETITCNAGNGNWGDWAPWGACSTTCPGGIEIRSRANRCVSEPITESRPCALIVRLTQWTPFSPCSQSCPGGVITRTRRNLCTNQLFIDSQQCAQQDPDFGPWTAFGPCSSTCAGMRERRQFDPCGGAPNRDEEQCPVNLFWTPWGSWSMCSQSCFGGTQTRIRSQPCTGQNEDETQTCGSPGSWGVYSSWSLCSVSCGTGSQFRTRIHSCANTLAPGQGVERQQQPCTAPPCCRFLNWGQWSSCTESCNYGVVSRTRPNICPQIPPMSERRFCFNSAGEYTEWGAWGDCSQTCPGGSRARFRTQTCTGVTENQVMRCEELQTFTTWSLWTVCSRTCAGGMQSRQRTNTCDRTESEVQNRECNTDPGRFNPPGPWSSCSASCSNGVRSRTSTHTCGAPARIERQNCGSVGSFLNWSPWGPCSATCPGGLRSRSRRHQCTNEIDSSTEPCGPLGSFLPWSVWTVCSQQCAGGSQTRSRRHTCTGVASEARECGRAPFLGDWSLWGSCTVTCDTGRRIRTRRGFCGASDQTEGENCARSACCSPLDWQTWSPCTVSCGRGQQSRQRFSTCSQNVPIDQLVRNCDAGNGVTTLWTQWSACPVSCGGSERSRSRTNTCQNQPLIEIQPCGNFRCPSWTLWSPWSACSVSCFDGVRVRTRECSGGQAGIDCLGTSRESLVCTAGDGGWSFWGAWTRCSASCGGGFFTRTRVNSCGLDPQLESGACNTDPGFFGLWTPWSACSASCGVGTRSRARTQSCTGTTDLARESCTRLEGAWLAWTPWSTCTATCGGGLYTRRRSHTCSLPDESETERCNTSPGVFLPWSQWTGCSRSCGGGLRSRTRTHTCGIPDQTVLGDCGDGLCPYWSGWTEFGACSVSCGTGVRLRTRDCQAGVIGVPGCLEVDEFRQTIICINEQLDEIPWSPFTPCSRSCGGGFMSRQRTDPCGTGPERDVVVCNTDQGSWTSWGAYSACTARCGGGRRMRRRTHTCGAADDVESIACNTDPGFWSLWSPWTPCSANCGVGRITRNRQQSCTGERQDQTETCQRTPCAIWGGWSTWGPCSVSCGSGREIRSRLCQGGRPGAGFCFVTADIDTFTSPDADEEFRICNAGDCCGFDWSGWSACCQYSPRPIQIRFEGNRCGEPWIRQNRTCPFGIAPLPNVSCDRLDILFESADNVFDGFIENARTAVNVRTRVSEVYP